MTLVDGRLREPGGGLREGGNDPQLRVLPGVGHHLAEADDATIEELAADLAARLLPRELPPVLLAIEGMG